MYFSLFPTRYTILFRLHTVSAILFPLHVSGLTGPSSGGLNCTCSLWYSPSENGIVYRHYIKILLVCCLSYRLLGIFFVYSCVLKRVEHICNLYTFQYIGIYKKKIIPNNLYERQHTTKILTL